MRRGEAAGLVVFFVAAFSAAAIGSLFPPGDWYASLAKPSWTPPNWLFGPVWTLLYAAIAIAGWLVWRRRARREVGLALGLYFVQLALNASWSWLFFGLQKPGAALALIVALLAAIALLALLFRPISRLAALLLLPYFAWVAFATALNAALWQLNA